MDFNGAGFAFSTLWTTAIKNVSLGAWFKTKNPSQTSQPIIVNGNTSAGYGIEFTGGTIQIINLGVGFTNTTAKIIDTNWHHVFMTLDNSNALVVYLDGVSVYSGSLTPSVPATNSLLGFDGFTSLYGKIDDARCYTRPLSAAEVTNLYYGIEPSPGPANWYKLDEGSGTTATDSGSAAKNGTISTATYSTDVFMVARTVAGSRTVAGARSAA